MSFSKKQRSLLMSLVVLVIYAAYSFITGNKEFQPPFQQITPTPIEKEVLSEKDPSSTESAEFIVTKVIDGDTIEVNDDLTVRYIGIDTPETVAPRQDVECFGKEASEKNRELLLNKKVVMEKDVSETDRYGRLLRYVYVENIMVNELLVRDGYAQARSYPPDIKYQERLRQAEREARERKSGLWERCEVN